MLESSSKKIGKFIFQMIFTGVLFFAICIPFKLIFSLVPGMTEVRPANVVPPVMGLMFGMPAALGITIGNFISDLITGTMLSVALKGAAANFMYTYIPYVMWYKVMVKDKKVNKPSLNTVNDILKYIFIVFIDSLVVTTMLTFIFENAGFSAAANSGLLLFFNNFDFAMVLGVPALAILGNTKLEMTVPQRKEISSNVEKLFRVFNIIPYCIITVGVVYFVYSIRSGAVIHTTFTNVMLYIFIILLVVYVFRPMANEVVDTRENGDQNIRVSIKGKVSLGFLMIAAVFICFSMISTYIAIGKTSLTTLERWSYVYNVAGIATNIIFAVTILFLLYVENNITTPVEFLSGLVALFAKQEHGKDNDGGKNIEEQCRTIKTGDEIEMLAVSFSHMMRDIDSYVTNLALVTAERERVGAELNVATHIQKSMLPCIFPAFPDRAEFDIFATMDPAKEVGGDFYDFFMVDKTHLAIVVADVSGKGVPAALFMVIGKTLIKDHTTPGCDLGEVFTKVNNLLCESNSEGLFITAFEGVLDLETGQFQFVNAGHELPFICKSGEEYKPYKVKRSLVLAGMEDMKYKSEVMMLSPGDVIFQYTDGVTEATNSSNELYGMERLEAVLNKNISLSPSKLLSAIKSDIEQFVGEAPQFDDITMLCLEYKNFQKNS